MTRAKYFSAELHAGELMNLCWSLLIIYNTFLGIERKVFRFFMDSEHRTRNVDGKE